MNYLNTCSPESYMTDSKRNLSSYFVIMHCLVLFIQFYLAFDFFSGKFEAFKILFPSYFKVALQKLDGRMANLTFEL